MTIEIKVPDLPESVADATIATWHKKPGDLVARDEVLVDIETDKVVLEVPAPEAGVLGEVVGVIGCLEATEAVKLIAGVGEPLVARMLTVDALTMNIRRVPLPKHVPDCPVCGEQPTITAIDPANYIQPACAI